jgi:hypothetical protein
MTHTEMRDPRPIIPDIDQTGALKVSNDGMYITFVWLLIFVAAFLTYLVNAASNRAAFAEAEALHLRSKKAKEDIDKKLSEMADARRRVEEAKKAQRIERSKP